MSKSKLLLSAGVWALAIHALTLSAFSQIPARERVLIETPKPYGRIVDTIRALGGTVSHEYKKVDGIAAEVPAAALQSLRSVVGTGAITKDIDIATPRAADTALGRGKGITASGVQTARASTVATVPRDLKTFARNNPGAYVLNNLGTNIDKLHARGLTGNGVIVAVIDSGIRPGYPSLDKDDSVIGGIDFVTEDRNGFSSRNNDPHGTFAATMVSANAIVNISQSPLLGAIKMYAPEAIFNSTSLPLIGTAPESSIYVVRVFGEAGAPESRIIAAIDHVIEVRELFDRGKKGGINIQVCNLSFGNSSIAVGRDLLDRAVDALLEAGIIPVVAAGNAGPSSLTGSSPGSAFSAITVGAASPAANERIYQEYFYPDLGGPGIGLAFRPNDKIQTASFSSRGPHADGRLDPDVMANGFANFGQGYDERDVVSIAGGTSFSTPIVSGVAAVLRQAFPGASARQIRNAIIASANPALIDDGSTVLDEGRGMVDALAAYDLLDRGRISDSSPSAPRPGSSVEENVENGTNLNVRHGSFSHSIRGLRPGERGEVLYFVEPHTRRVVIRLTNVAPLGPEQNILFGDDVWLAVHSAKTSQIGDIGDFHFYDFTLDREVVVDNPEPGIMRITIVGDWTNAGKVSADVSVFSRRGDERNDPFREGEIEDKQQISFFVDIQPGTSSATFRLEWDKDWSHYPTSDLDLYVISPSGEVNLDAAQLNSPEAATIIRPQAGRWQLMIDAFSIQRLGSDRPGRDRFELFIDLER